MQRILFVMTQQRRLTYLLLINVTLIVGLVVVGVYSHSLGLLAAGGEFTADSLAIALGIYAIHRRDVHGNKQATTYVALINALFLLVITVFVAYQSVHRLFGHTPPIHGLSVFIVATLSAAAMFVGALLLGRDSGKEDLHMKSVLLDTISDGLAAAAVAITGIILYLTHNYYWLDSVLALLISAYIAYVAVTLLAEVTHALTHGTALDFMKEF